MATHWPIRGRSGHAPALVAAGVSTHNRGVTERENRSDELAKPTQPDDWRTSPTTGELEYFDGRDWVPSGLSVNLDVFIRPAPPAEQARADSTDTTGTEPA